MPAKRENWNSKRSRGLWWRCIRTFIVFGAGLFVTLCLLGLGNEPKGGGWHPFLDVRVMHFNALQFQHRNPVKRSNAQ